MERSSSQMASFVVSIVLARILAPEDFGLIALVLVFTNIAGVFIQAGFSTALVQKKDADNIDFSSVFFVSLAIAVVFYVALFACAPLIASFYERNELVPVIRCLSFTLIIGVFNSIQNAYVARHMLFKKLFFRSICAVIPSGIAGIFFAYYGFGVWALVIQQLANVSLMCIFMWFTVKWRPQLLFSWARVKELLSFGWKLLCSSLLDVVYGNLHSLVIGKIFAPTVLGFYSRGSHFPSIIISNINSSIQAVLFPAFSMYQDDKSRLKQLVRRSIVTSSFVIVPLMAMLAALAEPLVLVVLGEKWLPCVPFVQIYCFIYSFWPIHTSNLSAINAVGRSDIFLKLEIIKKIVGLLMLVLFIYYFRTPIGIACSGAVTSIMASFINAYPNKTLLNYGYAEQMKDIFPSYLLSFGIGLVLFYVSSLGLSPIFQLIILPICGCVIYVAIAKLLQLEGVVYLLNMICEYSVKRKKFA